MQPKLSRKVARSLSVDQVMKLDPCYEVEEIKALFGGKKRMTFDGMAMSPLRRRPVV